MPILRHRGAWPQSGLPASVNPTTLGQAAAPIAPEPKKYPAFSNLQAHTISETDAYVSWNVDPACSGRVRYGVDPTLVTALLTNKQIAPLTYHNQHLPSPGQPALLPGTTYYYRVVESDTAQGLTGQSSILSFLTAGAAGIGPRYDLYGAGAGGNFPAWPTGANVFYVPASVAADANPARALSDWINANVPDGASPEVPSIVVFDSSGGGVGYGAGTEYVTTEFIWFNGCPPGTGNPRVTSSGYLYYRKNITFWGYNCKIRANFTDGSTNSYGETNTQVKHCIMNLKPGGWENMQFLGFTIQGTNTAVGTWDVRYQWSEPQKAWRIGSFNHVKFMDCYEYNIGGDWLTLDSGLGPAQNDGTIAGTFYGLNHNWNHGPYNADIEVAYCRFEGAGNMGLVMSSAMDGCHVHHNYFGDSAISPLNIEEPPYAPAGYRMCKNLWVHHNTIENWAWWLPATVGETGWAGWAYQFARNYADKGVELNQDWTIEDNTIIGGPMGYCLPSAEIARYGYAVRPGGCGGSPGVAIGTSWAPSQLALQNLNFIYRRNTHQLSAEAISAGYGLYIEDWDGVVITDNDLQGENVRAAGCTAITFSGNGTSSLVT